MPRTPTANAEDGVATVALADATTADDKAGAGGADVKNVDDKAGSCCGSC